ncbi:hypothetical protein [Collimonas fungivorans]|uniref:hypothetical protein n=1 Tax=Collimonas fungivorans TaxID=158899 RepID=UPI003FA3474F
MLNHLIVKYDIERYPFARIVASHLKCSNLAAIHHVHQYPRFDCAIEQSTELHHRLYAIGKEFFDVYGRFIRDQIAPMIGDEIVYQARPNFRFQLPGNVAVSGFHRDRDNHHHTAEINFWVPLTPVSEHTAVWIESSEGKQDFHPYVAQYGEILVFDGANLMHGNVVNESQVTRFSFDFRAVPARLFENTGMRSVNTEVPMSVGCYFAPLDLAPARDIAASDAACHVD